MPTPPFDLRLTATDASFLYAEKPEAPMHIGTVALLDGQVALDRLVEVLRGKVSRFQRFRHRAVATPFHLGHPTWQADPDFDVRRHVRSLKVAPPGGEAELSAAASGVFSSRLERDRPLWEVVLIEGLAEHRSALVVKLHHAMVDGVGANEAITAIFDLAPDAPVPAQPHEPVAPASRRSPVDAVSQALWENARLRLEVFAELQNRLLLSTALQGLARQRAELDALIEAGSELRRPLPRLPFNAPCTGRRKLVWCTLSFAEARAIRGSVGGTVNDVVLTVIAGALSEYARMHGLETAGRSVRVMVPVNLRSRNDAAKLGNQVSALPAVLPLDIDDPVRRLRSIHSTVLALKRSGLADRLNEWTRVLSALPPALQAGLPAWASGRTSPIPFFHTVATNVPGPQVKLYLLGVPVLAHYPFVPVGYGMGAGFAIYSYDQKLFIGITSDTRACPDVELLRDLLAESIGRLREAAGVAPIAEVEISHRRATVPPPNRASGDGSRQRRATRPPSAAQDSSPERVVAGADAGTGA